MNPTTFEQKRTSSLGNDTIVVVGGQDPSLFLPNINASKWDGEVFVNLNFDQLKAGSPVLDRDRVSARLENMALEVYPEHEADLEAGITLYQPPTVHELVIEVTHSPGVYFSYQPPLTPERIADGEWMPEKAEGSYVALYDKRDHILGEQNYGCGIVGKLYRWKCTDARGRIEWCGNLNLVGNKLHIPLPMAWLATAHYPVYLGSPAVLGWDDVGDGAKDITNTLYAWAVTMPEEGILTDMGIYGSSTPSVDDVTIGVYQDDGASAYPYTVLATSTGGPVPTTAAWMNQDLQDDLLLPSADRVCLVAQADNQFSFYKTIDNTQDQSYRVTYGTYISGFLPTLGSWSLYTSGGNADRWSIYATYAPAGGPDLRVLRRRQGY